MRIIGWRFFLLAIISLFFCWPPVAQELAAQALADIQRDIELSQQQMDAVAQEIAALKKDQKKLSENLITTVARKRQLDNSLRSRSERLVNLLTQKTTIQNDIAARRHEIGTTLALMERVGLRPPPAILAHPDDSVRALRSSGLLKSLMDNLTQRMQNLHADLARIVKIESLINTEKTQIEADLQQSQLEKQRLQSLLDEKKTAYNQSQQQLATLQEQSASLADRAQSLQELVQELENLSKQKGGDAAALLPIDNHFARQRGQIKLPVVGLKMQAFEKNRQGDFHGELYETALGALITTPVDAVVRYAGSFRSYGQLLVLDVGQNYHLVLAGMGQIYVQQGQILLAGEPIGAMSATQQQVAPMFYIELRKDGTPIDPAPWWKINNAPK